QILMEDFWYNQYTFFHLLNFEGCKPNNKIYKNLPSFHGVKLFLSRNGFSNICIILIPNKLFNVIPGCETFWVLFEFVLFHTTHQIISYSCIKYRVVFVGGNVSLVCTKLHNF